MLGDSGGVHHATVNKGAIWYWWMLDNAANIGVPCGSPSQLVVDDLDVKHGIDGRRAFWSWVCENSLELPPDIPWVRSPSGGVHLWLRLPPGRTVPSRNGVLPSVDVKGDGGYVVVPPSMLLVSSLIRPEPEYGDGEVPVPYQWISGCPCQVPAAPAALLDALDGLRGTVPASTSTAGGMAHADLPSTDDLIRTGLTPGSRNRDMYRLAVRLWRRHGQGGRGAVEAGCHAVWRATPPGDHPFSWSEVIGRIESARRFAAEQDRRDRVAFEQFKNHMEGRA